MIHNYCVVAVGRGDIVDILGKNVKKVRQPKPQQFVATIDLDRTLVHYDFTGEKVARLRKAHKGDVELAICGPRQFRSMRASQSRSPATRN